MSLHPETQVVASVKEADVYTYVVKSGGARWTVNIKESEFAGLSQMQRRMVLATRVAEAIVEGPNV